MSDLSELGRQLDELANHVGSINIKEIDPNEVIDEKLLAWYEQRFKMLKDDGVPNAITYYIERVAKETANERTKATIIQRALEYSM